MAFGSGEFGVEAQRRARLLKMMSYLRMAAATLVIVAILATVFDVAPAAKSIVAESVDVSTSETQQNDPCITSDDTVEAIHQTASKSRDALFTIMGKLEEAERTTDCKAVGDLSHQFAQEESSVALVHDEIAKLAQPQQDLSAMCLERKLEGVEGRIQKAIVHTLVACSSANPAVAEVQSLVEGHVSAVNAITASLGGSDCAGLDVAMKNYDNEITNFNTAYQNAIQTAANPLEGTQLKLLAQFRDSHLEAPQQNFDQQWFQNWSSRCEVAAPVAPAPAPAAPAEAAPAPAPAPAPATAAPAAAAPAAAAPAAPAAPATAAPAAAAK